MQTEPLIEPSHSDVVVNGLSEVVGGPVGRHATPSRFWTPVRIVLAIACVALSLAWVQKQGCANGFNGSEPYAKYCYTDVFALYFSEGLSDGKVPYRDQAVEYPVLTGAMMGVVGLPVHALGQKGKLGGLSEGTVFYYVTAAALAGLALATVWAIARMRRTRPFDAALLAAAPIVVVTAYVNWDFLAIALSTLGLYAWSRRHPLLAGILLGLGGAAKLYPLFFFWPLLLLCIRARKVKDFLYAVGAAIFTLAWVNVPVFLVNSDNWGRFLKNSKERGVDWGTLWYVWSRVNIWPTADGTGHTTRGPIPFFQNAAAQNPPDTMNFWALALFSAGCVGIGVLALMAPRRPRLGQLVFLVIAAFLLPNKVWSQQFVLWLVPLAVLARPKWRLFLAWQACELFYFACYYPNLLRAIGAKTLMPDKLFLVASGARAVGLIVFCGFVIGDILHPDTDVVRQDGTDDPDGGVLVDSPLTVDLRKRSGVAPQPA